MDTGPAGVGSNQSANFATAVCLKTHNVSKKLIIDPWVTTITSLSPDNYGFDVDYDGAGNLFVYGGINQSKVAKYDVLGNLIWTFSGVIPGIPWTSQGVGNLYIGNFLVDKITGKIYLDIKKLFKICLTNIELIQNLLADLK